MAIVRWRGKEWDPIRELLDWQKSFGNLFDVSMEELPERISREAVWSPSVDVSEDKENIEIKADVPGVSQADIDISIAGNVLTIKGERKHEEKKSEKDFHRVERFYGSFTRSMTLPEYADTSKIRAEYKNGVLDIIIPKTENAKPKQIKVEVK